MKINTTPVIAGALLSLVSPGYAAFYGDAPDEHHPWAIHDDNRPKPIIVTPGTFSTQEQPGKPPSDAVILFDGADLSKWESTKDGSAAKWIVKDGFMQVTPTGDIRTKEKFGDCQLHVEFAAPAEVKGDSQGRGNSGIFLMGMVEIQVLDCYNNVTYADGYAGSVYGVNPPMANPLRAPGQFQVYDIAFRRPIFQGDKMIDPGRVTVFINGVLVQENTVLEGPTGHMTRTKNRPFPETGPLQLQDHNNPTRFRNIWYRELPKRAIEGGTDGPLTTDATTAKRKEIAATIRATAATLKNASKPVHEMMRLMESLTYEKDEATIKTVEEMAGNYVADVKALAVDTIGSKKDEVRNINNAFKYLIKFKSLPSGFGPAVEIEKLIKEQGWDKKR